MRLTEAQVLTLRRMMTGTRYQLRGDGKKARELRPTIAVQHGTWANTVDHINAPSVPVLYRLGLVDFIINRGQEATKYYNVRLTDEGMLAAMKENALKKEAPWSDNALKEAVPATAQIHVRVTPDRKKRYVRQAQAEGMKLSDWIQKHMDSVCDAAGQPDTAQQSE